MTAKEWNENRARELMLTPDETQRYLAVSKAGSGDVSYNGFACPVCHRWIKDSYETTIVAHVRSCFCRAS